MISEGVMKRFAGGVISWPSPIAESEAGNLTRLGTAGQRMGYAHTSWQDCAGASDTDASFAIKG